MAERGYSFSLTTFRYSQGESCRPGLSAGRPAGEGEDGAQPTRSGLPAAGQDGVWTLQSHRVPGGSAEPGPRALGGGGGWARAGGAGLGKATGIRRLRLRGARSLPVSWTAAGAARDRSGGWGESPGSHLISVADLGPSAVAACIFSRCCKSESLWGQPKVCLVTGGAL